MEATVTTCPGAHTGMVVAVVDADVVAVEEVTDLTDVEAVTDLIDVEVVTDVVASELVAVEVGTGVVTLGSLVLVRWAWGVGPQAPRAMTISVATTARAPKR